MVSPVVEYVVTRKRGEGWSVVRNGAPIGRRYVLVSALEFATHLAEREALRSGQDTRVVMDREDTHCLPRYRPWRQAA
nr:hypothetical protein [Dyella sp. ASV24]